MNRHERLSELLTLVSNRGHIHVDDVVSELGVSPATARRDLDSLAQQQLIVRTRGGATVHPGTSDLPLRYKAARAGEQKAQIAASAISLVQPGQVIGLNGGTTTTQVARELATSPRLVEAGGDPTVVVTNAVNIAAELAVRAHLRVVLTGGVVKPLSYELTGPLASLLFEHVWLDILFLGVNALDPALGASAHDDTEAAIGTALASRAQKVIVVAEAAKLNTSSFAQIVPASSVDAVITDDSISADLTEEYRQVGIDVITAARPEEV